MPDVQRKCALEGKGEEQMRHGLVLVAVLVCGIGQARCDIITYTIEGVGSGSIGTEVVFTDAPYKVTATYDSAQSFEPFPGIEAVINNSATVTVAGITATLTNQISTAINHSSSYFGISDSTRGRSLLFLSNTAYASAGLSSPLGGLLSGTPITANITGPTDHGNIVLTGRNGDSLSYQLTGQVKAVPEPGSLVLLGMAGAMGVSYLSNARVRRLRRGIC